MIPDSNILNNKRSVPSFSVQILSIFTFSRRKRASFSHYPHYKKVIISHFPTDFLLWKSYFPEYNYCIATLITPSNLFSKMR